MGTGFVQWSNRPMVIHRIPAVYSRTFRHLVQYLPTEILGFSLAESPSLAPRPPPPPPPPGVLEYGTVLNHVLPGSSAMLGTRPAANFHTFAVDLSRGAVPFVCLSLLTLLAVFLSRGDAHLLPFLIITCHDFFPPLLCPACIVSHLCWFLPDDSQIRLSFA